MLQLCITGGWFPFVTDGGGRVVVAQATLDAGERPGLTTDERARMKALEKENRELKRANEVLKAASAFFGAELDRQSKK